MSDWAFLNAHRVPPGDRGPMALYGSTPEDGFNGAFLCRLSIQPGGPKQPLLMIASDGMGWQHVSVTIRYADFTPTWEMMCKVKDLFWEPEDAVIQIHPPHSLYVNQHPHCLHLWRPTMPGVIIPLPHPLMVGLNRKEQQPTKESTV